MGKENPQSNPHSQVFPLNLPDRTQSRCHNKRANLRRKAECRKKRFGSWSIANQKTRRAAKAGAVALFEPFWARRVEELHRAAYKSVQQTPIIRIEPTSKVFQSLLPDCATSSDVTFLLTQAKEAELEEEFDNAKRWLRQVAEVAPLQSQRREALDALERIERKMARQFLITTLPLPNSLPVQSVSLDSIEDTYTCTVRTIQPKLPFFHSEPRPAPQLQHHIDIVPLASEKSVDYRDRRDLLKAEQWREADQETCKVMLKAMNRENANGLDEASLKNFPGKDLQTIDRLWVTASNGHFGFSVQKEIYIRCGGEMDGEYPGDEVWERFGKRVGWMINNRWQAFEVGALNAFLSSCKGIYPSETGVWVGGFALVSHPEL